ncbi:Protein of unknown function [Propionibacterium freudenreichii]|nr:Protein of unknown function [Propionibacterium freudenreichii]
MSDRIVVEFRTGITSGGKK